MVNGETGETLYRVDFPEPSGSRALELCLNREIELMIFAGDRILVDPFSRESLLRTYHYPVFHANAVLTEDPAAYMRRHGLPLTKIHGDWNPGHYPLAELAALPGVTLTASNERDFEIVPDGVDKGVALEKLAAFYGLTLKECAAVGDSDNDMAMLRVAALPIAMGNASPAVKAAARYTVAPNGEDGVARAIELCLRER